MTKTRSRRPGRLSLLTAGPLVAVGLLSPLGAAIAHADGTDDAFVSAVKAHGIGHESDQAIVAAGHLVCRQLNMGKTQEEVATDVMSSSTLDGDNSGYFVAVSERAYCPQYADIPE
jgi:predicted HD phosphohydrolase